MAKNSYKDKKLIQFAYNLHFYVESRPTYITVFFLYSIYLLLFTSLYLELFC